MARRPFFVFACSFAATLLVAGCGGGSSAADMGTDAGGDLGSRTDGGGNADMGLDAAADLGTDASCTTDSDGDGHRSIACGGDDCDDGNPNRYPGNTEICDSVGHDEDCNPATLGPDHDHDGFVSTTCCNTQPDGSALCGTDCDDTTMDVSPSAPEVCDGIDDNCDGSIDEGVRLTFYRDVDGDGYGDPTMTRMACTAATGYILTGGDCDDAHPLIHPGVMDICNGLDDDCNGVIDDSLHTGFIPDCDADGYGAMGATPVVSCMVPSTPPPCTGVGMWATNALDCNDTNILVHPSAVEGCDGVDNDCDGTVDGAPAATWCTDPTRAAPHEAAAVCTAGACVVSTCASGYFDCSSAPGCETPNSPSDCGACGNVCHGWGTAPPACVAGVCTNDVVDIATGAAHTCALRADGSVACWGYVAYGELGNGIGTGPDWSSPQAVVGLTDAVELAIGPGAFRTCARRASGAVVCWGAAFDARGNPTGASNVPVAVTGITDATAIAAGYSHACAVRASGGVVCWGTSLTGELGDGTGTDSLSTPVAVLGLTDAVAVVTGDSPDSYTCALRRGGAVVCWGQNFHGQLGDGTTTSRSMPGANVSDAPDAVEIAGGGQTSEHTCARHPSGAVTCWGEAASGDLGDPTPATFRTPPVSVIGLGDAVELSVGDATTCARRTSGAVSCWGRNNHGQLGDGTVVDHTMPLAVSGLTDATRIAAGGTHACALRSTGSVVCWGQNNHGQLGDGSMTDSTAPVVVAAP